MQSLVIILRTFIEQIVLENDDLLIVFDNSGVKQFPANVNHMNWICFLIVVNFFETNDVSDGMWRSGLL